MWLVGLLIVLDVGFIYLSVIKITGWELPYPGNVTEIHDASTNDALNYTDMSIQVWDFLFAIPLFFGVCNEAIQGLMCSLFGFALGILLETALIIWLFIADFGASYNSAGRFDGHRLLLAMCVSFFPHLIILILRLYILSRAQGLRRTLKLEEQARLRRYTEHTRLVRP